MKIINERLIEVIKGAKNGKGKKELIKYLKTGKITRGQAIISKCYDCTCYYADGKKDCEDADCPLYPFMPFGNKEYKIKSNRGRKSKVCQTPQN